VRNRHRENPGSTTSNVGDRCDVRFMIASGKETGQVADTIVAANVLKMYPRLLVAPGDYAQVAGEPRHRPAALHRRHACVTQPNGLGYPIEGCSLWIGEGRPGNAAVWPELPLPL
jgi:hypothetical protein